MRVYLASRLGILLLLMPVFGIGFGIAVLGDDLTPEFLAGVALILFRIVLVSRRDFLVRRMERSPVLAAS